jgi:PAS domain-containing protein
MALTIADVTSLQGANAALEAAKTEAETARALLQDALESTTEAFALYDAEGRLVIFNKAYQQLYKHSPHLLEPGTSFETILRDRLSQNMVPDLEGDGEAWVQRRLATFFRASGSIERAFPGGTWWKINEQRTTTGGIAQIASDITAIRRAKKRFAKARSVSAACSSIPRPEPPSSAWIAAIAWSMIPYARCWLCAGRTAGHVAPRRHPSRAPGPWPEVLAGFADGVTERMVEEKRYIRRDGSVMWAIVSTALIRDGRGRPAYTVRHVQDITESKQAQEALTVAKTEAEASKALLQDALASLSDAFALFDDGGRLVVFNRAWEDLFGDTPDLLFVGATYEGILRERGRRGLTPDFTGDPEGWMRWRMDVFWNERGPLERLFPNGRWWRFIEKRTSNGGVAQIATEITAMKAREEATKRLQDQLAHATRVSTMGQMATGFAHELNQPLAAIANYAQGCLRRHRSGAIGVNDFVRVTELIVEQAHRAGDISRRIRRFVQKEAPEVQPIDANAAIREAVGLVRGEALHHDVEIRLDLAEDLPAIQADAVQIQQVVLNLARKRHRGDRCVGGEGRTPDPGHPSPFARRGRDPGLRQRSRHRPDGLQEHLQSFLHHQAGRHGHGLADLPLDRRVPGRAVGPSGQSAGRDGLSHAVQGRGEGRRRRAGRTGLTAGAVFTMIGRGAGRAPVDEGGRHGQGDRAEVPGGRRGLAGPGARRPLPPGLHCDGNGAPRAGADRGRQGLPYGQGRLGRGDARRVRIRHSAGRRPRHAGCAVRAADHREDPPPHSLCRPGLGDRRIRGRQRRPHRRRGRAHRRGAILRASDWVGREVTGDPRYYNANLVAHPYSTWKDR